MSYTGKIPGPWPYRICLGLVLLTAVILPRMAAIGDFIYLDEGYHAFMTSYIYNSYMTGNGFPGEMTGYKLYPCLLFWLWSLPGNTVMWIRLCDLGVATAMGYVFCQMLITESRNRWAGLLLGLLFLVGLNLNGAINSGFKNSFFPAFLCLCMAINIVRKAPPTSSRWIWAGALTGVAILFRETFVLFPIIGALSLFYDKNYHALGRYIAGGLGAAILITLISAILRKQFFAIFEYYFTYGKIYVPEKARTIAKFIENGGRALVIYLPLCVLSLVSIVAVCCNKVKLQKKRMFFWLACALAPIIEPYLKIGFLYHFSACLPGMAGLCACGYCNLPGNIKVFRPLFIGVMIAGVFVMLPYTLEHYSKLPITLAALQAFPEKGWPAELENESTTLQAAKAIKDILPAGGKVSASGFAYFIFPASLTLPPTISLGDLSRTYIYTNGDREKFNAELMQNQPDVVLLAKTDADHSATFYPQLKDIFDHNPNYTFYTSIEPDLEKNYGWLGYDIYKKNTVADKK